MEDIRIKRYNSSFELLSFELLIITKLPKLIFLILFLGNQYNCIQSCINYY
jgi:hypothetical protein